MIKAVFFDVANTLLGKSDLVNRLQNVLASFGHFFEADALAKAHKRLSEEVVFPDKTNRAFYDVFNDRLLSSLGLTSQAEIIEMIFEHSKGLQWKPYEDLGILRELTLPIGIGSNWDLSLKEKLASHFNVDFKWILGSEEIGVKKPNKAFFERMILSCGFSPEEILFVGDSLHLDIIPAKKIGMRAVLIDRIDFYSDYSEQKINHMYEINQFL